MSWVGRIPTRYLKTSKTQAQESVIGKTVLPPVWSRPTPLGERVYNWNVYTLVWKNFAMMNTCSKLPMVCDKWHFITLAWVLFLFKKRNQRLGLNLLFLHGYGKWPLLRQKRTVKVASHVLATLFENEPWLLLEIMSL